MASDFTGNNSEKIDRLVATVIEMRATLRVCYWIMGTGLPFLIGLCVFLVSKSFETSSKLDRLDDRLRTYESLVNKLESRLDAFEKAKR